MANPNINTLTDIFLPDGFGAFGFGDGGYGGSSELLNPQWNTNSGSFGIDPATGLTFVEATSTPSYVGASLYTIEYSSFFAKITPALIGGDSVQTALVIKQDEHNYVEMSIGPAGQFKAYVSDNRNITLASPALPIYNSVSHAYWRIRNDNRLVFRFDTSPDGFTWTELGSVPYTWDASSVVVTFFSGFTGFDSPGNKAFISNINLPGNTLALSGRASATTASNGQVNLSDPNALSASINAETNIRANFGAISTLPEGGLTDFSFVPATIRAVDPLITTSWNSAANVDFMGATVISMADWSNDSFPQTVPMAYRDGTYWQPATYADVQYRVSNVPDGSQNIFTNAQVEETSGLNNRLSLTASIYSDICCYSPGIGVTSVIKSTDLALTGQYSGKIVSNSSVTTLGDGTSGYFILPQFSALMPVKYTFAAAENLFGSVYLSTSRANTSWFASFIFYDEDYNILSESTYLQNPITNKNTHPGGNVWQIGNVYEIAVPNDAVWAAVVPVVNTPGGFTGEVVYTSNHSITGASLYGTEVYTEYNHPKTANINVKADRVNYAINSGFNTGTDQWFQTNTGTSGTPNPVTMSWDGAIGYKSTGSMRVSVAAPSGTFTGTSNAMLGASNNFQISGGSYPIVQGLKSGHTYTISAWIMQGPNCPDVYMNFYDGNFLGVQGISANTTKASNPENIDGNWVRVQTTYTVPPTGLQDYNFYFFTKFTDISHAPYSFWIDSILVEETDMYSGYFDGGFASPDYHWEFGGTPNMCRSYYYKKYADKLFNLNNSIKSVLPVGEYYKLEFALPIK